MFAGGYKRVLLVLADWKNVIQRVVKFERVMKGSSLNLCAQGR
jgi:hypothetical protein